MLITLQELELHRVVASKTYAPGEIDYRGADFRQVGGMQADAAAELVGMEIRVRGRVRGKLEPTCDRCLLPVILPVDREFDVTYRPMETIAREEEVEISADELEVGFFSGEGIDLLDLVTEQVILAVPMKVVCREDCRGLCPTCGANRNLRDCNCSVPELNSPFASLR